MRRSGVERSSEVTLKEAEKLRWQLLGGVTRCVGLELSTQRHVQARQRKPQSWVDAQLIGLNGRWPAVQGW